MGKNKGRGKKTELSVWRSTMAKLDNLLQKEKEAEKKNSKS